MVRTALLSVWDKSGLLSLAELLIKDGWRLIASGGTAQTLRKAGYPAVDVEQITGEPEMLGGRVKTLHPAVHAGILAPDTASGREALAAKDWPIIDLIVVNLYPFQSAVQEQELTLERAVEYIDIGGSALLRAGAKNHQRVAVLSDPADYPSDLDVLDDQDFRLRMAQKVFRTTAAYDQAISQFFSAALAEPQPKTRLFFEPEVLRYGENPHQRAAFYPDRPGGSPFDGQLLSGKPLSYNNLLDLDGAWRAVNRFRGPAVVVVKHTSPCGIARAVSVEEALPLALASDPVSAFGSVIASNREVGESFVSGLGDLFLECLAAPGFTPQALQLLEGRENLRLLKIPHLDLSASPELRSIPGGYLEQESDPGDPGEQSWQVATRKQPSEREWEQLRFAWRAVMEVKSNAVLLVQGDDSRSYTVGIGGGQPNRVDCVRIAGERAGDRAAGSVLASDAFFPFPDGIQQAADLGAAAVIQPGGSVRDSEVIQEADRLGLVMVLTGRRHFRH